MSHQDLPKEESDFKVQTMWGERGKTAASGFTAEDCRDTIGTALTAGAGITVTPNDGADTITVASTITQYTDEMARDALGTALVAGAGISVTPNDGADTITIANTVTAFTTEDAQDATGAMLANTATVNLSYADATPALTADVVAGSIGTTQLTNLGVTGGKIAAGTIDQTKFTSLGIQISSFSVATGTLPGNVQGCYLNGYFYQPSSSRLNKFDAKTGLLAASVAPPSAATFPAAGGGAKYNASLNKIVCALSGGFALYDPTNDTFGSLIAPTGWGQAGVAYDSVSAFIYYSTLTGNRLARCDTAGANQSNGGTWTNGGFETFVSGTFVFGIENNSPSAGKLWKYTIASWPTLGTSLTLAGVTNITGARMCQTAGGLLAIPVGTAGVQFVNPTTMTSSAIVSLGGTTGTQSVVYDSAHDHVIASDGGSKIWVINATTFAVILGVVPVASAVNAGLGYDTDNCILWMSPGTSTPIYRFYV